MIGPKIILALGRIAAQNLLKIEVPIGRMRGQRFALVVEDGSVSYLAVEEPARFDVTRAESLIEAL